MAIYIMIPHVPTILTLVTKRLSSGASTPRQLDLADSKVIPVFFIYQHDNHKLHHISYGSRNLHTHNVPTFLLHRAIEKRKLQVKPPPEDDHHIISLLIKKTELI